MPGESKGAGEPAGRDMVRSSIDEVAWRPGNRSNGATLGAVAQPVGMPVGSIFQSSGSLRPDKPSSEEGRQRETTTADGSGRVDRGPRPGLSIPGPQDAGPREAYAEAAPLRFWAERPGCQVPLAAPCRWREREAGSGERGRGDSARGLLSQGWPKLFDKLIAWRGLADPGVTPVNNKGGVGRN